MSSSDVHVIMSRPIENLPGCGEKYSQKLRNHNIYTYGDLVNCKDEVPGVPMSKFKTMVGYEVDHNKKVLPADHSIDSSLPAPTYQKRILSHTWVNFICHIARNKGQFTRVTVGDIVIAPHRVICNVTWFENGIFHRRPYTPVALYLIQFVWSCQTVVSDDSDGEYLSSPHLENKLPALDVDKDKPDYINLNTHERKALTSVITELNCIRKVFK